MTLQEWLDRQNVNPVSTKHDPCVPIASPSPNSEAYRDLFWLSDYFVSSVTAGTVWLLPREFVRSPRTDVFAQCINPVR